MAEYYFNLIPTVPDYVPEAAGRERARERFASFVRDAQEVTAQVSEQVEFVCAMENFETVSCPACGTVLDDGWWGQAMDVAYGATGSDGNLWFTEAGTDAIGHTVVTGWQIWA